MRYRLSSCNLQEVAQALVRRREDDIEALRDAVAEIELAVGEDVHFRDRAGSSSSDNSRSATDFHNACFFTASVVNVREDAACGE